MTLRNNGTQSPKEVGKSIDPAHLLDLFKTVEESSG
jgi:hypothetical protein